MSEKCAVLLAWTLFLMARPSLGGPPTTPNARDCSLTPETVELVGRKVALPASGQIVIESHLVTAEDRFPANRQFPRYDDERLALHLVRSCQVLLTFIPAADCATVYQNPAFQVWTPAEGGGAIGAGSTNQKPRFKEEMWSGNMNWGRGHKPPPGDRYLVSRAGKTVVLVVGFETGPADASYLLGLQPEVAYYLEATNHDKVTVGHLADQTLPPGPVSCFEMRP